MQVIAVALVICLVLVGVFLGIGEALRCDHEETYTKIVFTSYDSIDGTSHTRPVCKECCKNFQYTNFKGTPSDQSYLEVIRANSDGSEIIPGEYYTVTATVPLGFYGYTSDKVWLNCRVENEDYMVSFNVEFREEFKEVVKLVEKKETITFRGRFYDVGCGFTDCELIDEVR